MVRTSSQPSLRSSSPPLTVAFLGVLLVASAVLLWPVARAPFDVVLASSDSEAPWHLWRYAASLHHLSLGRLWFLPPEAGMLNPEQANLFPASTLLGFPAYRTAGGGVRGLVASWNLSYLLALWAGALGTWLLVKESSKSAAVAFTAGLMAAWAPWLFGASHVGRLESIVLAAYPLHAFFLYAATVSRRGWGMALLAAGSFALLTLQGGFVALFIGMVEPGLALWCLARGPSRRWTGAVLLLVALVGAVALFPWVQANLQHPPPALASGRQGQISVPLTMMLPWGRDVTFARGYHVPPYLSWTATLLAISGLVLSRGRSLGWIMLTLVLATLMLGPELRVAPGQPILTTLPAGLLASLPGWPVPGTVWPRLAPLVSFVLILAAIPALTRLGRWAPLVGLIVAVEQMAYMRPWQLDRSWDVHMDDGLRAALVGRSAIFVPMDPVALAWAQASEDPARRHWPAAELQRSWLLLALKEATPALAREMERGRSSECGAPSEECIGRDAAWLARSGYDAIVIRDVPDQAEAMDEVASWLEPALGRPEVVDGARIWRLSTEGDIFSPCEVPQACRQGGTPKHAGGGRRRRRRP